MGFDVNKGRNTSGGRRARIVEYDGKRYTLDEWAVITGLSRNTIKSRLRLKWPPEEALGFKEHIIVTDGTLSHPNQYDPDGTGQAIHDKQCRYIAALADYLETTHAYQPSIVAQEQGVTVETVNRWKKENDWFKTQIDEIIEASKQHLEDRISDILFFPEKYDDALKRPGWANIAMFKTKAEMPEKYRDTPPSVNIYNKVSLGDVEAALSSYWQIQQAQEAKRLAMEQYQPKLINPPNDEERT